MWRALLIASVAVLGAAIGFVREFSGDFHWHVVVGRRVWQGWLGRVDVLSHTFAGQPVFVSSWLADAALAWAHDTGGFPLLYALRAICVAGALLLVLREMRQLGLPLWGAAPLVALVAEWLLFRFYLRPEMFAFLGFAALLHLLGAVERGARRGPLVGLVLLSALWPNVHGSVVVALAAIGLFSISQAVRGRDLRWLALPAVAFAASCLNPEGIAAPLAFRIVSPTWLAHTAEWRPLSFAGLELEGQLLLLTAIVSAALARWPGMIWRGVLFAMLAVLAARHVRFVSFAAFAALPFSAGNLVALAGRLRWRRLGMGLALAVGLLAGVRLGVTRRLPREIGLDLDAAWYPVAACDFARGASLRGELFNSYQFGSWLLYCLPGRRVFIDQRAWSLYPDAFYQRYRAAAESPAALAQLLDETKVGWAFVDYDPLGSLFSLLAGWELVYFDDQALIYARSPAPQAFRRIGPDRLPQLVHLEGAALGEAHRELERQLQRCAGCRKTALVRAAIAVADRDAPGFQRQMDLLLPLGETPELAFLAGSFAAAVGDHHRAAAGYRRMGELGGDRIMAGLLAASELATAGDRASASQVLDEIAGLPGGAAPAASARARLGL